ncbi:4Fe-4S single cluster domain-containing protein [Bacillus sp. CGMCC 1.16607]|uniref:4Fe-4S single cluster domain-containing protein n=1 Tax=Bacillus sp. CGMCC 1.16607 TaxID=3351842 RepID=UPI00362A5604
MINIYDYECSSEIYGPGKRFVIWVQGCRLHCKGCWNTQMWSTSPKNLIHWSHLFQMISEEDGIEGITLIGGEPMHQAEELIQLCYKVKEIGLSIVLFTGFEVEELTRSYEKEIIKMSDIIISGRYIEEQRNVYLQWRGSNNQQIIFNTDRYIDYILDDANYCEIKLNDNGEIIISGFPDEDLLKEIDK